ncbi:serine/threonine-protein kinase [Streptomyces sp. NPDC050610]|uniref:serine/threonine-protein kinase n=1 Tax=Streptomyces sp. NPDC050610 TaxID=3157097 RepID=UPI003418CAB0
MPLIGERVLERYEVLEALGSGAQGEVFAGLDIRTGDTVTIKFNRRRTFETPSTYGEMARDLVSEADSAKLLSGISRIPTILGRGWHRNQYCIVMEFVDGVLLEDAVLEARPLKDHATVAAIIGQLCEILHKVHSQDLVHRDVKPANIMLAPDGRLWLLDLGFAIKAGDATDRPCGTNGYAPPEQHVPREQGVTPRADVFPLGCMLLEMTIMHLPYADTDERFDTDSLVIPPAMFRLVPSAFRPLALRMVHREPAQRPDVSEVFDCLRPLLPTVGSKPPAKPLCPDPTEYYRRHAPAL